MAWDKIIVITVGNRPEYIFMHVYSVAALIIMLCTNIMSIGLNILLPCTHVYRCLHIYYIHVHQQNVWRKYFWRIATAKFKQEADWILTETWYHDSRKQQLFSGTKSQSLDTVPRSFHPQRTITSYLQSPICVLLW